jgi:hypothetical protein
MGKSDYSYLFDAGRKLGAALVENGGLTIAAKRDLKSAGELTPPLKELSKGTGRLADNPSATIPYVTEWLNENFPMGYHAFCVGLSVGELEASLSSIGEDLPKAKAEITRLLGIGRDHGRVLESVCDIPCNATKFGMEITRVQECKSSDQLRASVSLIKTSLSEVANRISRR